MDRIKIAIFGTLLTLVSFVTTFGQASANDDEVDAIIDAIVAEIVRILAEILANSGAVG